MGVEFSHDGGVRGGKYWMGDDKARLLLVGYDGVKMGWGVMLR
jgi:hypothetical protein